MPNHPRGLGHGITGNPTSRDFFSSLLERDDFSSIRHPALPLVRDRALACLPRKPASGGFSPRGFILAASRPEGMIEEASANPEGSGRPGPCCASGRTCARGWDGWVGFRPDAEPNQTSRAALLVPGLALRRQPALEG